MPPPLFAAGGRPGFQPPDTRRHSLGRLFEHHAPLGLRIARRKRCFAGPPFGAYEMAPTSSSPVANSVVLTNAIAQAFDAKAPRRLAAKEWPRTSSQSGSLGASRFSWLQ